MSFYRSSFRKFLSEINNHNGRSLIIICCLISGLASAQTTTSTSDDFYKSAREAAFTFNDYNKAKILARQALLITPKYAEVQVFLGKVFTWNKEYDSAAFHYQQVLAYDNANEEASIAYTDMEYWRSNYTNALSITEIGLSKHPQSGELLLRRAKILNALKRYKEAAEVTTLLLQKDNKNTAALSLASSLKDVGVINKIGINYEYTHFDKQFDQPWHLTGLSYSRYTKIGTLAANLNYANRFAKTGWQIEADAYPRISKTFYSYVSFGFSPGNSVFPKYRAGLSLFANLARSYEAEAGIRYLNFGSPTYVYTLYLGKYYSNFLFGLRTYVSPESSGATQTYNLSARYYFKGAEDFISLSLGSGISPDDRTNSIQYNIKNTFSSRQASLLYSQNFAKRNVLTLKAGLVNQELEQGISGNQVSFSAGYQRKF